MAQDDKTRANALIDKYDGYFSSLNVNSLCDELSQTVMTFTYTVFQVFEVMSERGYSQTALEQVATNLMDRINPTNVIELAKSMHGTILLNRVQYLMNCEANPNQTVCRQIAVGFQRANEKLREEDKKKPNDTGQIQRLTAEEIAYYKTKVPKGGKFNEEIVWDLPTSGTGFIVYNQDDLKNPKSDIHGYDQIGTKETIDSVMRIARDWSLQSDQLLQIGDLSRPGGIITPNHHGHRTGKIVDIRPLRNPNIIDERPLYYSDKQRYSVELTKEFIRFVRKSNLIALIRFNDGDIAYNQEFNGYVLKDGKGTVHDNHLHLEFR
jgi:hypothetical protein